KTIRVATTSDNVRISDFLETAPVEVEELKASMTEFIFEMENPNLQRIVRAFIKKYEEELYIYTEASKNQQYYFSSLYNQINIILKVKFKPAKDYYHIK